VNPVPVIGLEVHAQLRTRTKIFCGCRHEYGARPNSHTCPVCLGLPGSLPVLNKHAVELVLRLGAALGCRVRPRSTFVRKNYFYPDLPRNYQITQHTEPFCEGGGLAIGHLAARQTIPLERIHLEDDAGKMLSGKSGRRVDFNRAGVPLAEIVTLPALRSGEEARLFLRELRRLLRALDVCDGDMEKGSLRCDANISLRPAPDAPTGARVELKNLNTLRGVHKALDHEVARQGARLIAGNPVAGETRGWDARRGVTYFQRAKELSSDYRYFPEPDLPAVIVDETRFAAIRRELPELPAAREARFVADLGLTADVAATLCEATALAAYFEAMVEVGGDARACALWVTGEVLRLCGETGVDVAEFPVPPGEAVVLLRRVARGQVSLSAAKSAFATMAAEGATAADVIERAGLAMIGDRAHLSTVIVRVLAEHPEQVASYRAGKTGVVDWLMGRVMAATGGRADPRLAAEIIRVELTRPDSD